MNPTWAIEPAKLTTVLEDLGFDIEQRETALPGGGGSLTARKETGNRALVVKIDAGGRLQILLTEQLADDAAPSSEVAGVRLTITNTTIRRRTLRCTVRDLDQFRAVVQFFTPVSKREEPPPV